MRTPRPDREPDLTIRAYGVPGTAGSKDVGVAHRYDSTTGRHEPVRGDDGRLKTFTKDSSGDAGKAWRKNVAEAGAEAMRTAGLPMFMGPVYVEMTFIRVRTKGDWGTGRNAGILKDSAPLYPITRPDVLKHARAVEDSLTKIVWRDDSQVVTGPNEKVFAEPHEPGGVEIRVWALPTTVGEMPRAPVEQMALGATG